MFPHFSTVIKIIQFSIYWKICPLCGHVFTACDSLCSQIWARLEHTIQLSRSVFYMSFTYKLINLFLVKKRKIYISSETVWKKLYRPYLNRQFWILTFFSYFTYFRLRVEFFYTKTILYYNVFSYLIYSSLTGKWNFNIDYFQVLTHYSLYNFGLIEKCYADRK